MELSQGWNFETPLQKRVFKQTKHIGNSVSRPWALKSVYQRFFKLKGKI